MQHDRDAEAVLASRAAPDAFGAVFERRFDELHRYLARRVGEPLASELAAETFARAFSQRARFDPARGEVRPWLYGIAAKRTCCDAIGAARSGCCAPTRAAAAIR